MSLDSISKDINTIVLTPEAKIGGKQISSNGKIKTEMTINLINSKNLPNETSEQNTLGQNIAALLKHALKDQNAFTDYKVIFTHKVIDAQLLFDCLPPHQMQTNTSLMLTSYFPTKSS